jgi:selenide,water dikinase
LDAHVDLAVSKESQIIRPENAVPGDVIILTKPLGTQVAVNVFQWRKKPERWARVEKVVTVADAEAAFGMASESMSRLNLNAARLMHKVRRVLMHVLQHCRDLTGLCRCGH